MKLNRTNKLSPTKNKVLPGWFYTNERLEELLANKGSLGSIKNSLAIGGGGDFAFSLLSLYGNQIENIYTCDLRPISAITQDFKSSVIRLFGYETTKRLLQGKILLETDDLQALLSSFSNPETKKMVNSSLCKDKKSTLMDNLKSSKLWYRDSFWQINKPGQYLGYLTTIDRYNTLQNNVHKLKQCQGDFFTTLKDYPDGYYDLIYTSNILDNKKYHSNPQEYLKEIHKKLSANGKLISCNINRPKKMKNITIGEAGFSLVYEEMHHFSFISALQGHYDYSYFLYQK